ncbi:MAG: hypothetical protein ACUVS2_09960 [Candidatus Flexifilum sp.]|jgi:peptidoglycan/xylan/chitin deacetylase (PgdA/CDA1 family)
MKTFCSSVLVAIFALLLIGPSTAAAQEDAPAAYFSFIINVHDWIRGDESAAVISRLIDLFEAYGVRGDFYLTAPVAQYYADNHPDVVEKLCASDMTISYHVRPPHPLNQGFDASLRGLHGRALYEAIYAAETQALDLTTGELIPDQVGGYRYVAQLCGRNPVALGIPNNNPEIRSTALQVYTDLGAQMIIDEHETGAPLERVGELWSRPSDFSITRWTVPGVNEPLFWWEMLNQDRADAYDPVAYLNAQLNAWTPTADRPAYITALIHEENFYWRGGTPWDGIYLEVTGPNQRRPLRPPFDLSAEPTAGAWRSDENQALIWQTYEVLVARVTYDPTLRVVTSEDIIALAEGG